MRGWRVTLALCVVGVWCAAVAAGPAPRAELVQARPAHRQPGRPRRSVTVNTDRWLNLITDYTRSGGSGAGGGGWFPSPIPIQVPLQGENSGRDSVQVVLVPVPVPVPVPGADSAQCRLNTQQTAFPPANNVAPPRTVTVVGNSDFPAPVYTNAASNPPPYNSVPVNNQVPVYNTVPDYNPVKTSYAPDTTTLAPPSVAPPSPPVPLAPFAPPARPAPFSPATVKYEPISVAPQPPTRVSSRRPAADERLARNAPNFPPVEDSQILLEQFRAQVPTDPTLPPVVIDPVGVVSTDDYTVEELEAANSKQSVTSLHDEQLDSPSADTKASPERRRLKCKRRKSDGIDLDTPEQAAPPPLPRFERSMFLRARLTVPRADYTEKYSVWWDAASGASRVDFHGGTTSTYRMMKRDGRVQSVKIQVDRTGETDARRCVVSSPRRVSLAERALPALPDLQGFSFAGYVQRGAERAERWRHTLSGHSGELGGARGEALTFRHELLVTRAPDNYTTTPLWYSVRVDSSVLGADCDGYVHYFDEVQTRHHDSAMFHLDIADACEQVEITNRMESVEPLREFTMLRRDPRHDAEIEQYKRKYERRYADDFEEAVRKNVLIQSSRHTSSGNRQGASFELEINFLSDRLVVERRVMLGVTPSPGADPGEPFPHSRPELEALRGRLPRKFDWRERGGVTPVRNQWLCSSCWAFATVGAVEGALFVESGRLVPLSEQALVDCAGPYGGNGCKGTWPSFAYNYVKDIGLPALDEYTPYKGEELQCRADSVPPVTRISGHLNVTSNNIIALKVAIKKYGPTVVIIDGETTSFMSHKKDYYHDARCRRKSSNHAVLAVGWTVHRGETYFIIKNSWSTAWGEEGYVRMRASTNTCGVLRLPSIPRLRSSDVLRVPAAAPSAATASAPTL